MFPFQDNVSRETKDKICHFYELMKKWNVSQNLIQKKQLEPAVFWERHISDSLFLYDEMNPTLSTLDMGSGNGLPGVILSILGLKMTLSENDKKKVSFLRYIRSELELSFDVYEDDIFKMTQPFQQTTARAFTSLNGLIRVQKNVSRETSVASGVYLKGDKVEEELNEALKYHSFEYEIKNLAQGCVVKVNLKDIG